MTTATLEMSYPSDTNEDPTMDDDLKKALKELANSTAALNRHIVAASQAVEPKPREFRKAKTILASVVSGLAILGACWAVLTYTLRSELTAALIGPNQQIAGLISDGKYLRRDVDELRIQHSTTVFGQGASATPKALGDAADQLRQHAVILPRPVVAQAGKNLVQKISVEDTSDRWGATNRVLSYLSFLNANFSPPFIEQSGPHGFDAHYQLPPSWHGRMAWTGHSSQPNLPQLHPIDAQDVNSKLPNGPAYLLVDGGVLNLDGLSMKRVIVANAEVVYDGGRLDLEGVYFVNCTFRVSRQERGVMFAEALLSQDARTNFKG